LISWTQRLRWFWKKEGKKHEIQIQVLSVANLSLSTFYAAFYCLVKKTQFYGAFCNRNAEWPRKDKGKGND